MTATPDPIESMDAPALLVFAQTIPADPVPVACGLKAILDRRDTCHAVGLRAVAVSGDFADEEEHCTMIDLIRRMIAQVEDCDDEIDAAGAW